MTATTNGRQPVRASSRKLVLSPTPAKVSRNAHLETLARFAVCPLLSQPAVTIADTARKPSTNLGNLSQMNGGLRLEAGGEFVRLATRGPVQREAEHHEPDERVAHRLHQDRDLACLVREQVTGRGGLRGVVDGKSGPEPEFVIGQPDQVAQWRQREEGNGAKGQDRSDGVTDVRVARP